MADIKNITNYTANVTAAFEEKEKHYCEFDNIQIDTAVDRDKEKFRETVSKMSMQDLFDKYIDYTRNTTRKIFEQLRIRRHITEKISEEFSKKKNDAYSNNSFWTVLMTAGSIGARILPPLTPIITQSLAGVSDLTAKTITAAVEASGMAYDSGSKIHGNITTTRVEGAAHNKESAQRATQDTIESLSTMKNSFNEKNESIYDKMKNWIQELFNMIFRS